MTIAFHWNQGRLTIRPATAPNIRFGIAGDWAPIRAFDPIIEQDPAAIYGDLLPDLGAMDLSLVNLEAPLADMGRPAVKSGAVFKGRTAHVAGLTAAHFSAVTLANNHVFDFGKEAFDQTLTTLDQAGIRHMGAGDSLDQAAQPLILEKNGIRLGLVNFSEGEELSQAGPHTPGVVGWELDLMEEKIRALGKEVDCIVAIAHCGIEYVPFPPSYVAKAFHRMVDAGAHLVVGHHPHVPQGVEIYKETPIFYSLGNFVFYQPIDRAFRKQGYWLSCTVDSKGLSGVDLHPYGIGDQGLFTLQGKDKARFLEDFKAVSLPLSQNLAQDLSPSSGQERPHDQTWNAYLNYYGTRVFKEEIAQILEDLTTDAPKGAAKFRNRITTLQHSELIKDTCTRIMEGRLDEADPSLVALIDQWLTQRLPQENGGQND